jgi:hypothetical protein
MTVGGAPLRDQAEGEIVKLHGWFRSIDVVGEAARG